MIKQMIGSNHVGFIPFLIREEDRACQVVFILAALSTPVSLLFNQGATGALALVLFILFDAFFSKPRFNKGKNAGGGIGYCCAADLFF